MLPHRAALDRDLHGVGGDLQSTDGQAIEMDLPGSLIGKACLWLRRQLADDRPGKRTAAQVVQRRIIDDVSVCPARSRSRKFNRLLLARVANQVKLSLPICVQKPFCLAWRAPVSSTVTHAAVCRPARPPRLIDFNRRMLMTVPGATPNLSAVGLIPLPAATLAQIRSRMGPGTLGQPMVLPTASALACPARIARETFVRRNSSITSSTVNDDPGWYLCREKQPDALIAKGSK
jgi:hypothetical protein